MSELTIPFVTRRRRRWRGRIAAVGMVIVAAFVAGGLVMRASGSDTTYRTATVGQRDVESVLHGVGVIEPVTEAAVAFPASGTVASVAVAPGDTVSAGQPLASLDTAALTATLHQQQAALDQAQLTLQRALDGDSVAAPAQSFAARFGGELTLFAASTDDKVAAAQQAVLSAQHDVDADRSKAAAALTAATSVCGAIGVDPGSDPSGATASINACQTALHEVMDAQAAVSDAQAKLATAASALDDLLDQLASAPPPTAPTTAPPPPTTTAPPAPTTTAPPAPTTTTPPPPTTAAAPGAPATSAPAPTPTAPPAPDSSGPSTPSSTETPAASGPSRSGAARTSGSGSGGSGGGSSPSSGRSSTATTRAPSSADLVAYQSAVDAATANVTMAEQALAQATIVSPVAGTVVAVNMAVGDQAQAGSTTQTVLVAGAGGFEAVTTVSIDDVARVKVGQPATVTPDGAATPVSGTVVALATMPTTVRATTSYAVTIGLPADATTLSNGAIGSIGIVTGSASGLAVPTSAVKMNAGRPTVTVVDGSTTRDVVVGVGVVAGDWTQVTNGLTAGQQVVLATVGQPLPGSATQNTNRAATTPNGVGFGPVVARAGG